MANLLIHESSPYLLQHAHNPVNWRAWNDETLHIAKQQNKLMLISIGYSACHWCHVMEKQCFENEDAARIMNKYFICVKVDREERPDVDAVYMQALQLMSGQGGWPLNCFTLPDGRPVFGGTYFPLEKWISVLENLNDLYTTNLPAMEDYATRVMNGISQSQLYTNAETNIENWSEHLTQSIQNWQSKFDNENGGLNYVPKFAMPCNYLFLLNFYALNYHNNVDEHVQLTLHKMAFGGIYDQLGGGFSRYSTDGLWKVPHFEKMLYDNAQLVSLYSLAFAQTGVQLYKEVVVETLQFVMQHWKGQYNQYYAAFDADSEGEEGKYYVWTKPELKQLLGAHFELFNTYYNANEIGYWEHDNYILMRSKNDSDFCVEHTISKLELNEFKNDWKNTLLKVRSQRIVPGLDDKSITSWNALMLGSFIDAYCCLKDEQYLKAAIDNAQFIVEYMLQPSGKLMHSFKDKKVTINGFLEDYAFTASAFIKLYKATGNTQWLLEAKKITVYAIENFYDSSDGLFYFNSSLDAPLITRQKEVQDNVIPASNSEMAHVLFDLGIYFEEEKYVTMAKKMATHFIDEVEQFGSSYSNWARLFLRFSEAIYQVAIPAEQYKQSIENTDYYQHLNVFTYPINNDGVLPFVNDKKTAFYYICKDKVCGLPLTQLPKKITDA